MTRSTHHLKAIAALLLSALLGACSTGDQGPSASPEIVQAIKARKANYKEIGGAFKTVGDELKSSAPDVNSLGPALQEIVSRSNDQLQYFPTGSGPESHEKTRAKADIWANFEAFSKSQDGFVVKAKALAQAQASGADAAALAGQYRELGEACKGCHDRFRVPE